MQDRSVAYWSIYCSTGPVCGLNTSGDPFVFEQNESTHTQKSMEIINTNKNGFNTVKDKNGIEKKITYVRGREI